MYPESSKKGRKKSERIALIEIKRNHFPAIDLWNCWELCRGYKSWRKDWKLRKLPINLYLYLSRSASPAHLRNYRSMVQRGKIINFHLAAGLSRLGVNHGDQCERKLKLKKFIHGTWHFYFMRLKVLALSFRWKFDNSQLFVFLFLISSCLRSRSLTASEDILNKSFVQRDYQCKANLASSRILRGIIGKLCIHDDNAQASSMERGFN